MSKLPAPPKRPPMARDGASKLQQLRRLAGGVCVGCKAVKAASRAIQSLRGR